MSNNLFLFKCEKLYKFANDYKDEFSTTMAGQFCSSEDVCQLPSRNELEMHRKKYCNETLAEDHNTFKGVRYSPNGGGFSLTASIWLVLALFCSVNFP